MAYHLEGRLLEVCNCRVLCPCWIGEDPDYKTCDTIVAYHFDKGNVDGVDIAGRTIALLAHVPGNILLGNWTAAVYLDDGASPAQEKGAARRLHRPEGRPGRRHGQAHRQGRLGAEGADHVHGARRLRHHQGRRRGLRRARAVQERGGQDDDAHRHGVLDRFPARRSSSARRRATRRRTTPASARTSTSRGHNALQSTFVFDA
jgi:hypothetical protein